MRSSKNLPHPDPLPIETVSQCHPEAIAGGSAFYHFKKMRDSSLPLRMTSLSVRRLRHSLIGEAIRHNAHAVKERASAKSLAVAVVFQLVFCLFSFSHAIEVPPLRGRVNDYAGVMSQDQVGTLESRLRQFEQETGHQVAVLTLPTLEGEDIEGFSIRVAENWKIGKKGFDNGVILVVAVKDRRLRLEVGYGLEGVLPDAIAKQITSNYIVPRFRSQDYAGGIIAGIDAVLRVIKNEPLPESARKKGGSQGRNLSGTAMIVITLALFGLMAFAAASRRRNQMWATRGRHYPPIFWGGGSFGGGGYSGGGGFFGGGSDSGGFSGGGGSFGGGGASDSW